MLPTNIFWACNRTLCDALWLYYSSISFRFLENERRAGYEPDTVGAFDAMSLRSLAQAGWLNRDRIVAWGGILLALEMLFLGFMVLWHHDFFGRIDPPTTTDFVSFYAAGKLVLAGTPALAYNQAAHAAV